MPAAVSSLFGSSGTATPSRAPATPTDPGDNQSFSDELDRAQNQGSASGAQGTDSRAKDSASASKAEPDQRPATAKPGKTEKAVAKKNSRQADKANSAAAKGSASKDSPEAISEIDPDTSDADNGQQGDGSHEQKPQKKSAAVTEANATSEAVANAPIQAANLSHVSDAHANKAAKPDQSADSAGSQQAGKPAEVPATGASEEIPATDDSAQSTSSSASRTARSSKARSATAAKDDDGATENDSAQDVAAGIQALVASVDPGDSDADGTVAPVTSDTTPPIAKAAPRTMDDASLTGFIQSSPANPRTFSVAVGSVNDAAQTPPEAQFADANRSKIVSGITGKLLPDGGSMQLTLDPANLGPLQVRVEMKNGVMSASFETSNDQASKLLSHSLGDLKSALEAQGVTVEKLHVSQSPKQQSSSSGDSRQGASDQGQNTASQQEQQRKDMMRRMWRKLMKGQDPLDLVA